jgi:predicted regulator of Ras-like GTPase activity (Roadblock/LC7/MglB family)
MKEILTKLNKVNGVMGSMIMNRDGIVVASDFSVDIQEKSVGAVASSILSALEGALKRIDMGKFRRFLVTGSEGKIAMVHAGSAILLVMLNAEVNMGMLNVEIKEAAGSIEEKSKMSA